MKVRWLSQSEDVNYPTSGSMADMLGKMVAEGDSFAITAKSQDRLDSLLGEFHASRKDSPIAATTKGLTLTVRRRAPTEPVEVVPEPEPVAKPKPHSKPRAKKP